MTGSRETALYSLWFGFSIYRTGPAGAHEWRASGSDLRLSSRVSGPGVTTPAESRIATGTTTATGEKDPRHKRTENCPPNKRQVN